MNFFKNILLNGNENKTISQINFIKDFLVSHPFFLKIRESGLEDLLSQIVKNSKILHLKSNLQKKDWQGKNIN
jgi:hypothetical protein